MKRIIHFLFMITIGAAFLAVAPPTVEAKPGDGVKRRHERRVDRRKDRRDLRKQRRDNRKERIEKTSPNAPAGESSAGTNTNAAPPADAGGTPPADPGAPTPDQAQ